MRRTLRHTLNDITLRATGRLVGRFFDYETASGSNIGDIAIRKMVRSMIDEACGARPIAWTEIGWGALDDETVAEVNETCDLFVIGGGAYFHLGQTGQDTAPANRFLLDPPYLSRIRVPIICLAVGASTVFTPHSVTQPRLDTLSTQQVQAFFAKCAAVSVRDHISAQILQPVAGRPLAVVPDPALYSHAEQAPATSGDGRLRIGLNLPFSGHFTQRLLHEYLRPIAGTMRDVASRHNAKIIYFAHVSSEQIIPHWLRIVGLHVDEVHTDPATILQHYRGLTLHVGSMMHSCIFALANDVPTVALAYDVKLSALFELLGLQTQLLKLPEFDPHKLTTLIDNALARRDTLSATIADRRRQLRPSLDKQVGKIVHLIERSASERMADERPLSAFARR